MSGTGQVAAFETIFDLSPNGFVDHRLVYRRYWGQVRLEYSGQMTSVTFCNLPAATWTVAWPWFFRLMPVTAFRRALFDLSPTDVLFDLSPTDVSNLTCPQMDRPVPKWICHRTPGPHSSDLDPDIPLESYSVMRQSCFIVAQRS
jgi:hypothetical protein